MASVLIVTDLHLGDRRNSPEFEALRLEKLAAFIRGEQPDMVLNLGDTVSRFGCLRSGADVSGAAYRRYLAWRADLGVPFRECAVGRELDSFAKRYGQEPDSIAVPAPDLAVITVSPHEQNDHRFPPGVSEWLQKTVHEFAGSNVLIGSHVPYLNACSRIAAPGIYLETPPGFTVPPGKRVFWVGGHFHWPFEGEVAVGDPGEITAFTGGRFRFEIEEVPTFVRKLVISGKSCRVQSLFPVL